MYPLSAERSVSSRHTNENGNKIISGVCCGDVGKEQNPTDDATPLAEALFDYPGASEDDLIFRVSPRKCVIIAFN